MSDQSEPRRYLVITTTDTVDADGNTILAGTAINEVLWDGVTEWAPPEGTEAVRVQEV
jgi:hypothetical protein